MSRKDYIAVAAILREHEASEEIINAFVDMFQRDNNSFDPARFRLAANPAWYVEPHGNGGR